MIPLCRAWVQIPYLGRARLGDIFLKKCRSGPIPPNILPWLDMLVVVCHFVQDLAVFLSPFVTFLVLKSSQKLKAVSRCLSHVHRFLHAPLSVTIFLMYIHSTNIWRPTTLQTLFLALILWTVGFMFKAMLFWFQSFWDLLHFEWTFAQLILR